MVFCLYNMLLMCLDFGHCSLFLGPFVFLIFCSAIMILPSFFLTFVILPLLFTSQRDFAPKSTVKTGAKSH